MCVCVCVCARARARVCVEREERVGERERGFPFIMNYIFNQNLPPLYILPPVCNAHFAHSVKTALRITFYILLGIPTEPSVYDSLLKR